MLLINNGLIEVALNQWNNIVHKTKVMFVDKIMLEEDALIYMNESILNNVGNILETDTYHYITFDHNELVKIEKKTGEKVPFSIPSTRYGIANMQVYGDWLFYTAKGIYRINVDGTKYEKLFSGRITDMYVTKQGIYFINNKDNFRFYRMDVNGQNLECLSEYSFNDLLLVDDMFYGTRIDDYYRDLVSLDMDGQIIEVIKSGIAAGGMIKQDQYIYYRDQHTQYLKRWNLSTNVPELLVAKEISHFAMDDNFIYYSTRDPLSQYWDTKGLYRLDIKTNDTITLDDKTVRTVGEVQLLRDYVYIESDFDENPFGLTKIEKDGSGYQFINP